MNLHTLSRTHTNKAKRIARGGKRGTFSGRGVKGQRSRAGRRIRPAERDLIIRIPKRRGFKNKPLEPKPVVVRLGRIEEKLKKQLNKENTPVIFDRSVAQKLHLISPRDRRRMKILGSDTISFPLIVRGVGVSLSAREKIERAGGKIEG